MKTGDVRMYGTYDSDILIGSMVMTVICAISCLILYGLGFFVYQTEIGGLAIILLVVIYAAISALAVIPFLGVFVQTYVMLNMGWPLVSYAMGIEASWLTTLLFLFYLVTGIIFTFITSKKALGG